MSRLAGLVAVVAGGGAGIGAATAARLALEGAAVVVGDLDGDSAAAVAADLRSAGGTATGVQFDIADQESVRALLDAAVRGYGGVDAVHVNAGDMAVLGRDTDIVDEPLEVFDRTIAVNLRGHVLCTRAAVPLLLERGGGSLVYTSSGAAFVGERERPSYAMSKAGILALVRHVASRWGREGIRANALAPGLVLSEVAAAAVPDDFKARVLRGTRSTRLGTPADIAGWVAMLVSPDGEWVNGQVISVDGGATMR